MMPFCVWSYKPIGVVAAAWWTSIGHNIAKRDGFECSYNRGGPLPDKVLSKSKRAARVFAVLLGIPVAAGALTPGNVRAHAIVVVAQPAMNSRVAPGDRRNCWSK